MPKASHSHTQAHGVAAAALERLTGTLDNDVGKQPTGFWTDRKAASGACRSMMGTIKGAELEDRQGPAGRDRPRLLAEQGVDLHAIMTMAGAATSYSIVLQFSRPAAANPA